MSKASKVIKVVLNPVVLEGVQVVVDTALTKSSGKTEKILRGVHNVLSVLRGVVR